MTQPTNTSVEFTIRHSWCGPVIYVRTSTVGYGIQEFIWGPWRKARDSERNAATVKLMELNKS